MPEITVSEEISQPLEILKREGDSQDELIDELANIDDAGEITSSGGDQIGSD